MSTLKIGINGFGRIGRKVLRLALDRTDIEVVAINDLSDPKTQAHLLAYDSVHKPLDGIVKSEGGVMTVTYKGRTHTIKCFSEKDPTKIPWGDAGAILVHESTGVFTDREKAALHLKSGAKRVIISAPSKDADATFCMGVNENTYDPAIHTVVSNASCTTNCLAPLAKVLDDSFGIVKGTMTTIHSYTNDQNILDLPHKDLRRARAAAMSMIPTSTGAAKAIGLVLPHLKGKLDGFSVRVPTPNVSLVDFVVETKKPTSKEAVNAALKTAAQGPLKGILAYTDLPLVSCDYNGVTLSSTVDSEMTFVMGENMVKVISWYDNESGFSARMLDLSVHMARKGL